VTGVAGRFAYQVTLGEDANYLTGFIYNNERANAVLHQQDGGFGQGLLGAGGNHLIAFGCQDSADLHRESS
jgi:hypothetical protein